LEDAYYKWIETIFSSLECHFKDSKKILSNFCSLLKDAVLQRGDLPSRHFLQQIVQLPAMLAKFFNLGSVFFIFDEFEKSFERFTDDAEFCWNFAVKQEIVNENSHCYIVTGTDAIQLSFASANGGGNHLFDNFSNILQLTLRHLTVF
jgi:hypothetical protein